MDHEPHHHLILHNDSVKVFNLLVSPRDSIILHSHDQDTIAIAIGDPLVTVGVPAKEQTLEPGALVWLDRAVWRDRPYAASTGTRATESRGL